MKHSIYTSYDELPLMLSVAEVAAVLGISRAGAYELVHGNEFPALKIGSRIVVPKDIPSKFSRRLPSGLGNHCGTEHGATLFLCRGRRTPNGTARRAEEG